MDPNMTLRGFWDALGEGDVEAAGMLRNVMQSWTARGGFLPSGWTTAAGLLGAMDAEIRLRS